MEVVTIAKLAGEGGGMTLLGRQDDVSKSWEFAVERSSHLSELLNEEDGGGPLANEAKRAGPVWVSTWAEAISLLDVWPWAKLVPVSVLPEFQDELLLEVTKRLVNDHSDHATRSMNRWLSACSER